MVGERGEEMGELSNIPFSMGMEAQTRCSTSTPMLPIFVDTNLDTHLALTASPSETIDDLRAKIRKGHLSCFPHLGDIVVGALKVKRKSLFYHLVDSMLVGSAFHGLKGTRFLLVEISQPNLHIDQGGPRGNKTNLESNSLLKKHHSNGLQAYDESLPNNVSVEAIAKNMSDSMICCKPSLFAGGMVATQVCKVGSHYGKLLNGDDHEDCIMEDDNTQPFLNPELSVGTGEKSEAINSVPLLLNGTVGETGIPNTSQSLNVQRHSNEKSNPFMPELQNWRSVKKKKSKLVSEGSQVLEDCGQLSKSMQLLDENKERKSVAERNTGIFKESKSLGREDEQHEILTTITNGEVRNIFAEKSNGKVSDLRDGESPNLMKKTKSAEVCSHVQKACGQLSNNIECKTTNTTREENALNNEGFAEKCEILGGRDGNFGIPMTNKKAEGERLFDGNSNGNAADIQTGGVTKWQKDKLVAKCSQVEEGCGQLKNDIDSRDLVAARDENVMINDVFGKEPRSASIGDEILPPNSRKKSKRKRKGLCDLNEDSTGCGLSQIQEKNKRKRPTVEGNNIVECSSKQLLEDFETTDFLSGQINRPEKVNVSKSVKEDGITALTKSAMTLPGNNCNASAEFEDEDIICTQLSTGKKHETNSKNFDDEFQPNTAGKESEDLQRKSDDARGCIIEIKANSKISIEQDSPKTTRKESKDFQSKADDARKYDTEKQVKPRRKMSSKHAIWEYEQENSAIDVNGKSQISQHNPLLNGKSITTEETHRVSVALEENRQRKDPMIVPVKCADISTHIDGNQPCNITGKKKNKRSRNDLLRRDSPERITKEQVPKDDIVIESGKREGDKSTLDDGKEKTTHTPGENGGIAYLSAENLKKNAITDPGNIPEARGMISIVNKEAYADSDTGMGIRNNEKCNSGMKKVKLSKTSPSKESQERCVSGIDNRLMDEVIAKIGSSSQHSKDEMMKPKDTYVSSSEKKQDNDNRSLKCQAAVENSLHKSTHIAQLDTNNMSYTRKASKERQCIANSTEKIQPGNQKVASERNIVENLCHKLKQAKNSATTDGFDRIQSLKEKRDNDFETKKPQRKAEDGVYNGNNTADSCQTQKRKTGFVTDIIYKDKQSPGEQHGIIGASRKLQTPTKTRDGFSMNKIKNKDNFSHQQEKVLKKPKGDKHFTKNRQSLFKGVNDESTEEENEIDSYSVNSSLESFSGNSSDSLYSDGESREKVSKCRSIKSQADRDPSTSGPLLSTAAGIKQDTGGSGPIQSRFVHLLAKKTGLGDLFKIASAQKKAESENFSGQFVSTESSPTNMVFETQESQIDPLQTAHDNREPPAFSATAVNANGIGKVLNNKAPKANSASKSESTPKASGKSSLLVEKPTDNSVHLKATGKGMPQMQQSGGRFEPRIRSNNKRTASKQ